MKILNDRSFFRDTPPLIYSNGHCRVYSSPQEKAISVFPLLLYFTCRQPLYINAMFRGKAGPDYRYRQENASFLGMEYIREGSLAARRNDRCYLIEPGEAFLLLPGQDCEIATGPEGFCVKDSLSIHGDLLNAFLASSGLDRHDYFCNFNWQRLEHLFDQLQEFSMKTGPDDQLANSILTYEILEVVAFSQKQSTAVPKLANLLDFMRSNLEKSLTLKDLTAYSGYSETSLLLAFREVYGKTPHQKLIEMRMEHAAKLLFSRKELSVKEIAGLTGYSNPMNFSTAFRQYYGSSPRQYRNAKIRKSIFS